MTALNTTVAANQSINLLDRVAKVLPSLTEFAETSIVLGSALAMVAMLNLML